MSSQDRLLGDEAIKNELIKLKDSDGKYILSTIGASDPVAMRALIDYINTQKRLYAESVIGEDIEHSIGCIEAKKNYLKPENMCMCSARIENNLRAEQRARVK